MKIGLTYDSKTEYLMQGFSEEEVAEFDKEETVEAIENAIRKLGFETERIGNIKNLVSMLAAGKRWDLVFNIAEGLYGISREAQVPSLLDAYRIPYTFSSSEILSLALDKAITKKIVGDVVPTPDFWVVENLEDIEKISFYSNLFAKPIAEGTSKGISHLSKISSKIELKKVCTELLEKFKQPVLVEKFLPGREFTVGIVGTGEDARVIGMMEVLLSSKAEGNVYSYFNKQNYLDVLTYDRVDGEIAGKCKDLAMKVWKCLGCRDGGRVDVRLDENGIPNFIEINPLAGLNPVDSDLPIMCRLEGISFDELIKNIVDSAMKRIK